MLSYQHIYHAGNPADVQKHALLAALLSYMSAKDKALCYIETHSGRGLYDLGSSAALKTGEAQAGIARILAQNLLANTPYTQALAKIRAQFGDTAYPGSPLLAAQFLRPDDRIELAELHPQEHAALSQAMQGTKARLHQRDGFEMAQAVCPPTPRRGVLLIDPSYEIKSDYARIPGEIAKLHRKWNVGVIALWYPLLLGGAHHAMLEALEAANYPNSLRHEVAFAPVRPGHRMVGSGMFVINAPWGLADSAAQISRVFSDGTKG